MSHYFTIPVNTDGIVSDLNVAQNLKNALNSPFSITDVFIYSHGWWTSATRALANYNQFSIEFAANTVRLADQPSNPILSNLPGTALGVAIHWPSMISDDDQAIINKLEPLSFYTMGHRAYKVGENAVYSIIRLLIEQAPNLPRIHFFGHSFGCRVVCSAIQEILNDHQTIPGGNDLAINTVLLEPAFDNNDLEPGNMYSGLCKMPNLRLLVTYSALDKALNTDYPLSQEINIFKGPGGSNQALGATGPTPQTIIAFCGAQSLTPLKVGPGFSHTQSAAVSTRLVTADLTSLHKSRPDYDNKNPDHHSDIFIKEIYELICGFLFR